MKLISTLFCLAVIGGSMSACNRSKSEVAESATARVSAPEAAEHEVESGTVEIPADTAARLGITTVTAGPATLHDTVPLYGSIAPNAEAMREVRARFPGLIKSVRKALGDSVKAGDVLATVESDDSLQTYAVTAPISGTVTARSANTGQKSGELPLFVITNVETVWAELAVFPRDRAQLKAGLPVQIKAAEGAATAAANLSRIDVLGSGNQSVMARVVLNNSGGQFPPGLFVSAEVAVSHFEVPLAVPRDAVQTVKGEPVVFEQDGSHYRPLIVRLGRQDSQSAEVLEGLVAGTRVVVGNSYVIKAELGKPQEEEGEKHLPTAKGEGK